MKHHDIFKSQGPGYFSFWAMAILIFAFAHGAVSQSAIYSVNSGAWGNGSTWSGGTAPGQNDTVYIQPGFTVNIDAVAKCYDIHIANTAVLQSDSGVVLDVNGNWINDGQFSPANGTVRFVGSSPKTVGGSMMSEFYNVEINTTSTVSLGSDQYMHGVLYLTAGTFVTTGYELTLASDMNNTASIAEIQPGADIVGNITMQRYLNSSAYGWRFLGSPVQNATLAQWDDDFTTSGFPGSAWPSFSFCNIYTYDETATGSSANGYNMPADISDTIKTGHGYWCYLGGSPSTVDVSGPPVKGTYTFDVSYTPSAGQSEDGWNLVANPYPSSIDWDAAGGWNRSGIAKAIYIWNPALEQYSAYVDGVGTNGGTNVIASSQAFWVQTLQANPVMSCTESVKVNSSLTVEKPAASAASLKSMVKLTLGGGNNYSDEAYVCFSSSATDGFDENEDALKLFSNNPVVGALCTVIDTTDLAINCYPSANISRSIPVRVKVGITGKYIISRDTNLYMPAGSCVFLHDLVTDSIVNLNTNPSYSFTISDTTNAPRFLLHIGMPITKNSVTPSCYYTSNGKAILTGGLSTWNTTWKDQLGNTLTVHNNVSSADTLSNLAPGKYVAVVSGSLSACTAFNDTIIVDPADTIKASGLITNMPCRYMSSGQVTAFISGGAAPYSYSWSNGANSSSINGLNPGVYTLVVSDARNCQDTSYYAVSSQSNLNINFTPTTDTLFTVSTSTLAFFNLTTGQTSLTWDFGDGTYSNVYSPVHTYSVAGTYTVSLMASDSICTDTAQASIVVLNPTLVNANALSNSILIYNAEDGAGIRFNLQEEKNARIKVTSVDGRLIHDRQVFARQNTELVSLSNSAAGIYLIEIVIDGNSIVKKFTR